MSHLFEVRIGVDLADLSQDRRDEALKLMAKNKERIEWIMGQAGREEIEKLLIANKLHIGGAGYDIT